MHSLLIKVVSFSWHFLECSCNLLIQLTLPNWSSDDTKSGFCSYTPWFWGDFNQSRISLGPKKRILSKRVRLFFIDFKMPFKPTPPPPKKKNCWKCQRFHNVGTFFIAIILGQNAGCTVVQYKNIFAAVRNENQSNRLNFCSAHWWKVPNLVSADTCSTFTDRLMKM